MAYTKINRVLSWLLLSASVVGLTACNGNDTTDTGAVTEDTSAETVFEGEKTDIPDDLMFEGSTVNILGMEYLVEGSGVEEADIVSRALFNRNLRVEERFGVELEFTNQDPYSEIQNIVRQSVNAGSDDYDVVFTIAAQQVNLINEGLYAPISELPYVNLEKPWWNKEYIESVSLNSEAAYTLFGNLTYNQVERTTCVFANVSKLSDKKGITADDLYDVVFDGKWTLDYFTELVADSYEDVNGSTTKDAEDFYGLICENNNYWAADYLAYGSGLEFTDRDDDGYPVLALNTERASDLSGKLVKLLSNNSDVFFDNNEKHVKTFAEGRALFMVNRLFVAGWEDVRKMNDDFILLPTPKYDETVDGYHAPVGTAVQWGAVTVTADELDVISAVLEEMCYDGYNTVTPTYYETALKLKYSRGDVDSQSRVLDMIVEGARTDFLYVNNPGGIGKIFVDLVKSGQNNFASKYASHEMLANTKIKNLVAAYEESVYNQ